MAEAVAFVNAKICFPIKLSYYRVFSERCYHCIMQLYDFMVMADQFTRRTCGKYSSRPINLKMFLIKTLRLAWQFLSLWDYPCFISITAQTFSDRFCFSLVIPSINMRPNTSVYRGLEIWQQGQGKPQEFRQKRRTVKLQEDLQPLDISCSKQYHIFLQHLLPSCALLMLWQHF